jgi:hypothetical protein
MIPLITLFYLWNVSQTVWRFSWWLGLVAFIMDILAGASVSRVIKEVKA